MQEVRGFIGRAASLNCFEHALFTDREMFGDGFDGGGNGIQQTVHVGLHYGKAGVMV